MIATADRQLYRAGLNPNAPIHYATVGGVCFSRTTERVSGQGSRTKRDRIAGSLVRLTDEQVDGVKQRLVDKVVRSRSNAKGKVNASIYSTTSPGFEPSEHDIPLADLVYLEPITEEETKPKVRPTLGADKGYQAAVKQAEAKAKAEGVRADAAESSRDHAMERIAELEAKLAALTGEAKPAKNEKTKDKASGGK